MDVTISLSQMISWAVAGVAGLLIFFVRRTLEQMEASIKALSIKVEAIAKNDNRMELLEKDLSTIREMMAENAREKHKMADQMQTLLLFRARYLPQLENDLKSKSSDEEDPLR